MHKPEEPTAIRRQYERVGARAYYRQSGAHYRNPHEPQVRRSIELAVRDWRLDLSSVLDLAAGSGEVTLALRALGARSVEAIDPFTFEAYQRRTGLPCGRETFEQIAGGALAGCRYSLIVCSFALHLLEPSWLPGVCTQLSLAGDWLLVLTPHKRPQIEPGWGWELVSEQLVQRVRSRLYRSRATSAKCVAPGDGADEVPA